MSGRNAKTAIEAGLDIDGYNLLRKAGASHGEIKEVSGDLSRGGPALEGYVRARESGGTRRELKNAMRDGFNLGMYADYRELGANDRQARDAYGSEDIGLGEYQMGRESGMSHRRIKKAGRKARRKST